ncbi:SGNH/GDSL hydrolase family protein [Cohnella soli]|uniref:SGNH/GDSL hydrolase family protein n=1 Tax=Cohnella soli TaxID=425005 RepID=A0ABW0I2W4_9BACL
MKQWYSIIRPSYKPSVVAYELRRAEFDMNNEILLSHRVRIDYVFFGDSITHYWELQTYFGRNRAIVVNRGIGGDSTKHGLHRFQADVVQLNPRYVVIAIGINDTILLDDWIREGSADPVRLTSMRECIVDGNRELIRISRENGIEPIVCSLMPSGVERFGWEFRNPLIMEANNKLEQLAGELGIIYIDYHAAMCGPDGKTLRSEYTYDGIHPNVDGYDIMAETLRRTLAEHGIRIHSTNRL